MKRQKKGGVVGDLVSGTGGLIIAVIITLVIVSTLVAANLLTANSNEDNATDRLVANFTSGIDNVSSKVPTILLIAAVVLLFGVLVLLVRQSSIMGVGGRGSI